MKTCTPNLFSNALICGFLCVALAPADTIVTSYNSAGAVSPSTASLCSGTARCIVGTESFDAWNGASFVTDFGTSNEITGTYSGGFRNSAANQYGGAGGAGNYPVIFQSDGSYSVTLNHQSDIPGLNYFGLWFSALDAGNLLQFYNHGSLVYSFTPANYAHLVGTCTSSNPYCGNPNSAYLQQDSGEQFAFLNFSDTTGYFDQVVFSETGGGGFESDNHTVGYISPSGSSTNSVTSTSVTPEPSTMVLMTAFLGVGYGVRRRLKSRLSD